MKNFFKTQYRIVKKDFHYTAQRKRWYSPFWIDIPCGLYYINAFATVEECEKFIESQRSKPEKPKVIKILK